MQRFRRMILAVGTIAWVPLVAEGYCAMCQTALTNSAEGQLLAGGLNSGVLFLLSAPFGVTGTILFLLYRDRLQAALRRRAGVGQFKFASRKILPFIAGKEVPMSYKLLRNPSEESSAAPPAAPLGPTAVW